VILKIQESDSFYRFRPLRNISFTTLEKDT